MVDAKNATKQQDTNKIFIGLGGWCLIGGEHT
jgi:hypothetical protein